MTLNRGRMYGLESAQLFDTTLEPYNRVFEFEVFVDEEQGPGTK